MIEVLLFGGSFDPIHNGHLIVSRWVAEQLRCPRVILLPGAQPPHKQERVLAAAEMRVELCQAAVAGEALFEVSDWETKQAGLNYTLHTVEHFRTALGLDADSIAWLIGMDSLHELHTWFEAPALVDACRIITAARPGREAPTEAQLRQHFDAVQVERLLAGIVASPRIDISSTEIRRRVAAGSSIRFMIPERVQEMIAARGLYRRLNPA